MHQIDVVLDNGTDFGTVNESFEFTRLNKMHREIDEIHFSVDAETGLVFDRGGGLSDQESARGNGRLGLEAVIRARTELALAKRTVPITGPSGREIVEDRGKDSVI